MAFLENNEEMEEFMDELSAEEYTDDDDEADISEEEYDDFDEDSYDEDDFTEGGDEEYEDAEYDDEDEEDEYDDDDEEYEDSEYSDDEDDDEYEDEEDEYLDEDEEDDIESYADVYTPSEDASSFDADEELARQLSAAERGEDYDDGYRGDEGDTSSESNFDSVSEMSPELREEYDRSFSGEQKVSNLLKITSDKFTRTKQVIAIQDIGITEPKKIGRQGTLAGLSRSVKEMGVVTPIHVMAVEDADSGYKYILIDGLRRIFAAVKNGISEIDAVVWHFNDYDRGMELLLDLSLILNRGQKRNWKEIWELYRILELQSAITPGTLEYLLQLEPGDAMKLKDVMLCSYSEVKEALLGGDKDLESCYKMLQKLRKEEDRIAQDDETGVSDTVEGAEDLASSQNGGHPELSDQDVLELLEMAESMDDENDSDLSFAEMNQVDDSFVDHQTVGDRHPLDPALRQAVLARDDFTCKCCGMRMIGARLGLIAVHHILPVHTGGADTLDNLVTLDVGCHIALHIMERNGGSIMMSENDFKQLLPNERTSLKRALKLARIAIEADKRKGLSKAQISEATKQATRHPMPGVGLKETQAMYNATKASK